MVREKKVVVEVDGKPVEFLLRALKFGQRNRCLEQATTGTNLVTQSASFNPYLFQELRLVSSIVSPVEFKEITKIRDLDTDVAEKLLSAVGELNGDPDPSSAPSVKA